MRRSAVLTAIATAVLLAGCGSARTSTSSPSGGGGGGAPTTVLLNESEFKIAPNTPTVAKTGKVTIVLHNNGKITHAFAVATPIGVQRTAAIPPGSNTKLTVDFTKPGSYTFYCPLDHHRMLGMQGMITVGASSGGAAPSTTSTSSTSTSHPVGY
jgi:uncharacterized cupredoxin-like copper-binding protein